MAKIISDEILYASQFVEYYTGKYFFNCDTLQEVKTIMAFENIYISDGEKLNKIPEILNKAPEDAFFVIVQFSKEENYTEHEYRLMRVQKRYIKRFIKAMKEDCKEQI